VHSSFTWSTHLISSSRQNCILGITDPTTVQCISNVKSHLSPTVISYAWHYTLFKIIPTVQLNAKESGPSIFRFCSLEWVSCPLQASCVYSDSSIPSAQIMETCSVVEAPFGILLDSGVVSASLGIMCKNGGPKPFYSANPTSFYSANPMCIVQDLWSMYLVMRALQL
jgi:hypothetical protein